MIGIGMASGRALSVTHVRVVALYDPKSGAIKHIHTVTTLTGATPSSEPDAIAEAKRHASGRLQNANRLAVAVSNDATHGHLPHRIDTKTKRFVPLDPKKTRTKRR
jgi:hypothetical protein